jgi:AcrR family transcriptional regulator
MGGMVSRGGTTGATARERLRPEERREQILDAAAGIALSQGLERITLRAVADALGVRPGLITHYHPAAEDLVVAAFVRAASLERERFFPDSGTPLERMAHFLDYISSGASVPLARMWLNARHLSRFGETLAQALREQDTLDRERLSAIVRDGVADGSFADVDPEAAAIRILIAVDGVGSYVNDDVFRHPALTSFERDVTAWTLGLPAGTLAATEPRTDRPLTT